MKTKSLIIILILFLLIILAGGLAVFLTEGGGQPALNVAGGIIDSANQLAAEPDEPASSQPVASTTIEVKPTVLSEKIAPPEANQIGSAVRAEKIASPEPDAVQAKQIQAKMLINGVEYGAAVKAGGSVYDLMNELKEQKKIDFQGKDYASLGFFIEEINGVKNNPPSPPSNSAGRLYQGGNGKNWLYYVNGRPAPVGVSNYKLKDNDVIEWRYEEKSF